MRAFLAIAALLNLACIAAELFYGRTILERAYRKGCEDGHQRRLDHADEWWTRAEQEIGETREKIWREEE